MSPTAPLVSVQPKTSMQRKSLDWFHRPFKKRT
ncbi:umcharacterized LOC128092248 homolog [Meriones unguiculatus]|nr:umcharacterized LOC128092248 homolog [Psammomys obesus]XP_060245891.1 umcharacterized LOC128092248 homolog [Meriones unguiculatus]